MFRLVSGATLIAALALAVLSGTAIADPTTAAVPLSLGGETLAASPTSPMAPYPFLLPCGGSQPTGPAFNFSGTATGPYPGSFIESGTVQYSYVPTPGTVQSPLTGYRANFTIDSVNATVTGTETMTGSALATCAWSPGGEGLNIGPVSTTFTATIATASGSYTDQGTSTATVGQGLGSSLPGNWGADLQDGSFVSTAGPTPITQTAVLSNLVAMVDSAGNVEVSVDATSNIVNAVLYEGNFDKVAPDVTPINGVASWKLTGLPAGTYTLYAAGFTVPSGLPGGRASAPVSVTVTIPAAPTPTTTTAAPPPTTSTPTPTTTPATTPTITPATPLALAAFVRADFRSEGSYTEVLSLMAKKVPAGATVRVACTGRGCPYAKKTFVAKRAGTIKLQAAFRHHRLHAGDHITVTISHPREASKRYSYAIRSHQAPIVDEAS